MMQGKRRGLSRLMWCTVLLAASNLPANADKAGPLDIGGRGDSGVRELPKYKYMYPRLYFGTYLGTWVPSRSPD